MSSVKAGGTTTRNYKYNGKGERVRSYLSTANTYTLYDEAGHWVGDYGANGTPVQQAIWMDDLPVGLRTAAAGIVSYIEPDHLGSPRVVIDPVANTAIWKWDIQGEAFGVTAPEQDPDGNGTALNLDMRFPGQRYDRYTGLNYNYFRDYEPGSGRYVQSDPIGLKGGISTYAYVSGSPVMWIDPEGLQQSFADCVAENKWDWGKLGPAGKEGTSTAGNATSGAQVANGLGNAAVGYTGSGMSTASHATSWQHAAGSRVGQAAQMAENGRRFGSTQVAWSSAGRFLGRVAVVTTIWEGFYDIGTMGYCGCSAATGK
ncbi:TPA: RHS repeat-associated core domain-containing protein [Pseudomonas aeruginosa]|nr:RHS repeat-associated core domain-containing protein [Pseudomonas aeruginosa]